MFPSLVRVVVIIPSQYPRLCTKTPLQSAWHSGSTESMLYTLRSDSPVASARRQAVTLR